MRVQDEDNDGVIAIRFTRGNEKNLFMIERVNSSAVSDTLEMAGT